MKIFIGTAEIAGMMQFLSVALKRAGHEVTTCVDNYGTGFFDYTYDVIIGRRVIHLPGRNRAVVKAQSVIDNLYSRAQRRRVFKNHANAHDLYVFIWNGIFPDSVKDYSHLKANGKRIVSIFLGSDVRHVSAFAQEYNLDTSTWEQWFHSTDLNNQLFRLRKAELFSDAIFSIHDQSGLAIRPYYKVYIPFETEKYKHHIPARKIPKIVHIPSRSGIKGTPFILKAMSELENEGLQFQFHHISGIPNKEVHKILEDADILVDELFLHGPGTLSLEGIASGCAVATKTMPGEIYESIVCNISFDNFKEKLKLLITDMDFRLQLATTGRERIASINNPERIGAEIVQKAFEESAATNYDYYPKFFSDHYRLPDGHQIDAQNLALTRQVIEKFQLDSHLNLSRMRNEKLAL